MSQRLKLPRTDAGLLGAFMALALAAFIGLKIGSEVIEGETRAFDSALLSGLRDLTGGSGGFDNWLRGAMLDLTALGDNNILTLMVLLATGYLIVSRRRSLAVMLLLAISTGIAASFGLKLFFARARPDIVEHLVTVKTASFPSGHAMNAAIVYLTLGALLARAERQRSARLYLVGVALTLTFLIGVSRIYLGVHWPTDVLAGWIFGAGWAAATSLLAVRLHGGRPG